MLFRIPLAFKRPLKAIKVAKEYATTIEPTKRVLDVSDAFGISLDDRYIKVAEVEVDINPGDVVLITGESGSGKSTLLRELADSVEEKGEFGRVMRDWELEIDPDGVVIESVGRDIGEALEILNYVGLNEANLYIRRFHELSDGQKHRFKLAKLIESGADVWVFDEFCSVLDRVTAKVVAYSVQKAVRRFGKTLIAATAHDDILYDLNPNIHVVKKLGPTAVVHTFNPRPRECTLLKDVEIKQVGRDVYRELAYFHYRGGLPNTSQQIFAAYVAGELAGVIVYATPLFNLAARNKALPILRQMSNRERLDYINHYLTRIARVIVAPKFRGIGLGTKLVKETLPLTGKKYVEALAVMAKYNPFFEKAGMRRIEYESRDEGYEKALTRLAALGFDLELLGSKKHNLKTIQKLTGDQLAEVQQIILKHFFSKKFKSNTGLIKRVEMGDRDAIAQALTNRRLKFAYLFWERPEA